MAKIGFVGSGKDYNALRAAGASSLHIGTWRGFQRSLERGDTAIVTRADRITRSPKRFDTITRELAEAGIELVILDQAETSKEA
jgi:DNA invertase Pin-like site-specific DNA recombinase